MRVRARARAGIRVRARVRVRARLQEASPLTVRPRDGVLVADEAGEQAAPLEHGQVEPGRTRDGRGQVERGHLGRARVRVSVGGWG